MPGQGDDVPGVVEAADGGLEASEGHGSGLKDCCDVGGPGDELVTWELDSSRCVSSTHPRTTCVSKGIPSAIILAA